MPVTTLHYYLLDKVPIVALAGLELKGIYRPLPPLCRDEKYAPTTPDFHIMVFTKLFGAL